MHVVILTAIVAIVNGNVFAPRPQPGWDDAFDAAAVMSATARSCVVLSRSTPNPVVGLVRQAFLQTDSILFGQFTDRVAPWLDPSDEPVALLHGDSLVVAYARQSLDRSCLLAVPAARVQARVFTGVWAPANLLAFINEVCHSFVALDPAVPDPLGVMHGTVMATQYRVGAGDECPRVSSALLSEGIFVRDYVAQNRPVVIVGAARAWPAMHKWSNERLRALYGHRRVHVKFTEAGEFEGCEPAANFAAHGAFTMPASVRLALAHPDLVVVRPAHRQVMLSSFLDLIEHPINNLSAYLEYSSLASNFPGLEEDIIKPEFATFFREEALNMWLSDGRTLGKLHFDPFDNLLCQLSGTKSLTLFDPRNNTRSPKTLLYEAHIPEAELTLDNATMQFRRETLLESTSMVMSPVNIVKPDFERFPKFADAVPLQCDIGPTDILYLPAFWWHEVQSHPDAVERRNLAVNYWFKPFFKKDFPCPDCPLELNHDVYRKDFARFFL